MGNPSRTDTFNFPVRPNQVLYGPGISERSGNFGVAPKEADQGPRSQHVGSSRRKDLGGWDNPPKVRETGLEPARAFMCPLGPQPSASANSAIPAICPPHILIYSPKTLRQDGTGPRGPIPKSGFGARGVELILVHKTYLHWGIGQRAQHFGIGSNTTTLSCHFAPPVVCFLCYHQCIVVFGVT